MSKRTDNTEFEIRFFEGIIRKNPDFAQAISALAELYTKKGRYDRGLVLDERLVHLRPKDPVAHYNLACSYSLLNDTDKALDAIKKAVEFGYHDFRFMEQDRDLMNLRRDKRFQEYFQKARDKFPDDQG